ncbi:MAG: hypothetical protein ACFFCQ_18555 [Promethearchaeota archaeon]
MIREIFVLETTGVPLFHQAFVTSKIDDILLSSFLGGLEQFGKAVGIDQEIDSIRMGNLRFVFSRIKMKDVILVLLADASDFEEELTWKVSEVQRVYLTYFEKDREIFRKELQKVLDKSINFGQGMLLLGDARTCLVFTSVLDSIYHELAEATSSVDVAVEVFYETGKAVGRNLVRFVVSSLGAEEKGIIDIIISLINDTFGWGIFQSRFLDFNEQIAIVEVQKSFETDHDSVTGILQKKQCAFIQGVLQIVYQSAFNSQRPIAVKEVSCRLQGDKICRHIIGEESKLDHWTSLHGDRNSTQGRTDFWSSKYSRRDK